MDDLKRRYQRLLDICARLETVADDLPDRVDRGACTLLAIEIVYAIEQTHAEEERSLLPLLAASPRPELQQLANRLRQEHDLDELAAVEVQETLIALAAGRPTLPAEATGYQLRSLFESVRRHVHAEQDMLVLLGASTNPSGPFS
ncbi:MAG: hypothetical protein ABS76_25480 [Pelagibacterium sp. SCN 64-44]|nr:MAG: hypothetical protein ABS76_25480 [Pelagibacterium sp. SCN 64-44]